MSVFFTLTLTLSEPTDYNPAKQGTKGGARNSGFETGAKNGQ